MESRRKLGAVFDASYFLLVQLVGNILKRPPVNSELKMISSPYCVHSRECVFAFCFASCKTSQNVNISQLLT